ncbi:CATRA system-associated protein [Catenuloplanes atrovinosus]|uniref:CRP-like cAMP-binding protein n=1 Tax=Catenuloplanes atrovinosus TaxID=137266 RepID=A0AAE3YPB8_9ACTN|nr:CATRA system-associated protein [Catenuloplanes atrovinosus]MDR7275406.1 CRP-like cAMP-binding protein [Catenuloplanes atrovinosus]
MSTPPAGTVASRTLRTLRQVPSWSLTREQWEEADAHLGQIRRALTERRADLLHDAHQRLARLSPYRGDRPPDEEEHPADGRIPIPDRLHAATVELADRLQEQLASPADEEASAGRDNPWS